MSGRFTFDRVVENANLKKGFNSIFGEKRVLELPVGKSKKRDGASINYAFSFSKGKAKLHKISKKELKELNNMNKLEERDGKGRRKYIRSARTGKPILNTANSRYRNSKSKNAPTSSVVVANTETTPTPPRENEEGINTFISENYNKVLQVPDKKCA